jgi:hypothetical protein
MGSEPSVFQTQVVPHISLDLIEVERVLDHPSQLLCTTSTRITYHDRIITESHMLECSVV